MIYPKCRYRNTQRAAIRYDGYVIPCCHFGGSDGLEQLRGVMGDDIEQTHITKGSLSEINNSVGWKKLMESWKTNPPSKCVLMCSTKLGIPTSDITVANSPKKNIQLKNI